MLHNHIIYADSIDWMFDVTSAQGCFLYSNHDKWLDFTSGWNVVNLGWNHPEVMQALKNQADKGSYVPMWTMDKSQQSYAELLVLSMPTGLTAIARATGGTEANEEAIKTACALTERKKIVGFKDSYHGQSLTTMAIGYPFRMVERLGLSSHDFIQLEFPQIPLQNLMVNGSRWESTPEQDQEILKIFEEKLIQVLASNQVAAVLCEPGMITGWGSTAIAPKGFLRLLRKLTKEYDTLLILDEVGTGFSRCGSLWAMQAEDVIPDIVTLAKGICNGVSAIGAMITTEEIASATYQHTNLISTFGWTPIACAVAQKTLEIHLRYRLWEKVTEDGKYILNFLRSQLRNNQHIGRIRGKGLEIGIEIVNPDTHLPDPMGYLEVVRSCQYNHLHITGDSACANIQLMPPLIIERPLLNQGLFTLVNVLDMLHSRK